jgi:hypothetical protein
VVIWTNNKESAERSVLESLSLAFLIYIYIYIYMLIYVYLVSAQMYDYRFDFYVEHVLYIIN